MEELESDSEISDTDSEDEFGNEEDRVFLMYAGIENDIHDRVIPESSDCLLVEAIIGENMRVYLLKALMNWKELKIRNSQLKLLRVQNHVTQD
ncbi:hypothetical protein AYI69_g3755 [Smittium culicis]|uniref:Uncharacterized protein n=1 Tax=Smittium culicis TaxID=133412 RepID=A0A1R1YIU9_9FUNG|nr:hypothetical protein AYI69_g3755 [Smittium culicis]